MKTFKDFITEGNRIITDSIQSEFSTFLTLNGQSVINGFYMVEYGDKYLHYVDTQAEVENYVRYILQKNELYYSKLNNALNQNLNLNYSKLIENITHLTSKIEDKKDETINNDSNSTTTNDFTNTNNLETKTEATNTNTNMGTVGVVGTETPGGIITTASKPFDTDSVFTETEKTTQSGTNATNSTTTNNLTDTLTILNTVNNTGNTTNTGTVGVISDFLQSLITNNILEKLEDVKTDTTETDINQILTNIKEYINIYNYNLWNSIIKDINSVLTIRNWGDIM